VHARSRRLSARSSPLRRGWHPGCPKGGPTVLAYISTKLDVKAFDYHLGGLDAAMSDMNSNEKRNGRHTQEAVVKVEPADLGTDVEGTADGVELEVGSWDLCAVGDDGALDDGTHKLGAIGESQTLETAAERVEEA
jgi:hypothetical protein